nr:hypothetical protein [Tanacetum cinerariifolium]
LGCLGFAGVGGEGVVKVLGSGRVGQKVGKWSGTSSPADALNLAGLHHPLMLCTQRVFNTFLNFSLNLAKNIIMFSLSDFANIEVKECGARIICEQDIEPCLKMTQRLLPPTQDAGLFHLSQEWSSANIDDEPPNCTRHIVWSAD